MGQDKGHKITDQLPTWAKQAQLRKIHLFIEKQSRKKLKHLLTQLLGGTLHTFLGVLSQRHHQCHQLAQFWAEAGLFWSWLKLQT